MNPSDKRPRMLRLLAAAPDDLLLMSRDDCHALGVSSIVVGKTEHGGLRRMFLAWPGHQLAENHLHGKLPVGLHDHRYSLKLQLLAGKVCNTVYRQGRGRVLNSFVFRSGQMQGPPEVACTGCMEMAVESQSWLSRGWWLSMAADVVHDVDCEGPAAWLVEEGPVERSVTRLFTPHDTVDTEGMYRPFGSAGEVREHVNRFVDLVS